MSRSVPGHDHLVAHHYRDGGDGGGKPVYEDGHIGGVAPEHGVDCLAGEDIADGEVDKDPEFGNIPQFVKFLLELFGGQVVKEPTHAVVTGDGAVDEELSGIRLVSSGPELPKHAAHIAPRSFDWGQKKSPGCPVLRGLARGHYVPERRTEAAKTM